MGTRLSLSVGHTAGPPFPAFPLVLCGHVTCSGPGGEAEVKGVTCRPGPRKPPRGHPPGTPSTENGSSGWIWNIASLVKTPAPDFMSQRRSYTAYTRWLWYFIFLN